MATTNGTTPPNARTTSTTTRQRITNFSRRFTAQRAARKTYTAPPNEVYPSAQVPPTVPSITTPSSDPNYPDPDTNFSSSDAYDDSAVSPGTARTTDSTSPASSLSSRYQLRPPLLHRKYSSLLSSAPSFKLPDLPWLCGTWHVTHSTLPMWRNKRNVRITYTRLPGNRLDDLVTYQGSGSDELQTVRGVDSPKSDGSWLWRGKGMLKVASSRWEVLGWGGGKSGKAQKEGDGEAEGSVVGDADEEKVVGREHLSPADAAQAGKQTDEGEQWVVTFFAKTMFTPAGIDIYSRRRTGLSERTTTQLKRALMRADGGGAKKSKKQQQTEFGRLVSEIFEIKIDDARDDVVEN
ncbi:MAG: hypothetical protein M1828_000881 [Chrysothrix sp. TS-e1954]|nr:MAG: hypothetical protein M1828_000881 [Chrysothrix sp. TS-e1954]